VHHLKSVKLVYTSKGKFSHEGRLLAT
jgi:hypothetical protein